MHDQNSVGSSSVDELGLEIDLKLALLNAKQKLDLLLLTVQNDKGKEILTELRELCNKIIRKESSVEG